jgi:hypothetical protein
VLLLGAEIAVVAGDLPIELNVFELWPLANVVDDQVATRADCRSTTIPMCGMPPPRSQVTRSPGL